MWIARAVKWLLPKEQHFFDLLQLGAECALKSGQLVVECCELHPSANRADLIEKMRDVEHQADNVIAKTYDALNRTFVTPFDRSDIYKLATALESITDVVFSTLLQILVHDMRELPPGSKELAAMIKESCELLHTAVGQLRSLKNPEATRKILDRIAQLEHDGDTVFRGQIGELFKRETDAIRLLKHKEFLEGLERTLDACDDVGNALETIVIKNA